jgi:hypothetical protein
MPAQASVSATLDRSVAHAAVGVFDLMESEPFDVGCDAAACAQGEHLDQLRLRSPERHEDLRLPGNGAVAYGVEATCQADDGDVTAASGHADRELKSGVCADEVEHRVGADAAGQLAEGRRGVPVGGEGLVGAQFARLGELVVANVERDDACGGYRAEDLYGEVARGRPRRSRPRWRRE